MRPLTLLEARTRAGLTQDQLADQSGIDQTSISAIERGRRSNPSFDTVTRLAKALGIAPSDLKFPKPQPGDSVGDVSDRAGHERKRRVG